MERVTQFNFLGVMFIRTWIGADILIAFLGKFQGQLLSIYCIGSKIYQARETYQISDLRIFVPV